MENIGAMKPTQNLHCGACNDEFDDLRDLASHLHYCRAAKTMLPLVNEVWFEGGDKTGHPLSHLITCLGKYGNLIKRYAYAVADDLNVLERAKLHIELCEKLGFKYNDFRPFESEDITTIQTRGEALDLLWDAIDKEVERIRS